jgi:ABC-type nitrate/sulfonate/bicarbonate transport system substrate-binding protein
MGYDLPPLTQTTGTPARQPPVLLVSQIRKKRWQPASVVAHQVLCLALLVAVFGLVSCTPAVYSGPVETITLATVPLEPSTLIFIAEEQGFFLQNGLDVNLVDFETGLGSANAILEGKADIAGPVTEYVLVGRVFNEEKIKTIGAIDKVDYASIIGRKDRGIEEPRDLVGKTLGAPLGTILEFRLGRFLELHGLDSEAINLVDMPLATSVEAVGKGEIDAMVAVPPYVTASKNALGDNAVVWPAQNGQLSYQLLVARSEWIDQNPLLIERLLGALHQAEKFLINNPDRAKAILQQRLNLTGTEITRIWSQNQFSLSLDQSLILAMEDEARWMMNKGLVSEKSMPDFLDHIYFDGLVAVKPQAVNLIR